MGQHAAYADLLGDGTNIPVQNGSTGAPGSNIVFTSFITSDSAISLSSGTTGSIVINDTGYYLVSYGVSLTLGTSGTFRLNIYDSVGNIYSPGTQYQVECAASSAIMALHSITLIVQLNSGVGGSSLKTPPYTLNLTNITGATVQLDIGANIARNPVAYMSVTKLF